MAVVATAALALGASLAAAQAAPDSSRCDSIVAASRIDSIGSGLYVGVQRRVTPLDRDDETRMIEEIASLFVPPVPFRMNVFDGPELMNALRMRGGDTVPAPRSPTVTGTYRITATPDGRLLGVQTIRESLMPGYDSAATLAITRAAAMPGFLPALDTSDTVLVDIRIGTDSAPGARRLLAARLPRMPVVDATPQLGNPPPVFPEAARADSVTSGEALLSFVVDRTGLPILSTVEAVRASSFDFLRAALDTLPSQRFTPARIRSCPVAEQVEYLFTFVLPPTPD